MIPRTTSFVATNANIRTTLGRDLTACGGAATCVETVTVQLYPSTTVYEERLSQLDLRFARTFQLPGDQSAEGQRRRVEPVQ